ncbi:MAG: hypothetical protein HZC37_02850 [Burkholderiales bacterium]|nr:hypothetical protein [Burkholderiales bacterium]
MAINEACFDGHALQRARGAVPGTTHWVETNGGIVNPLRVHVRPGQYLYRFANSGKPHAERLRGCWWVEHEVLTKIAKFVRDGHAAPRDAARYFLALPWAWTQVDRLIRARLVEKIDAYRGVGKPAAGDHARDAGTRFIPPQHVAELYQLFIPGMDSPELASLAFEDISDDDIWSARAFA